MAQMDAVAWLVTAIAILLTGISKSGLGSALGGVAVPFLALWIAPRDAVAVVAPVLIAMDVAAMRAWRGQAVVADLRRLLPAALVGIVLGTLAFGVLSELMVKAALGLLAVVFALDRLWRFFHTRGASVDPASRSVSRLVAWVCGIGSGLTSTLAHAGGPPLLMYLLARRLPRREMVATSVFFFSVINIAKLPFYIGLGLFTRETLLMSLLLLPLVPVGTWLGVRVLAWMPERLFVLTAASLLGLSGVKLLWDALVGG